MTVARPVLHRSVQHDSGPWLGGRAGLRARRVRPRGRPHPGAVAPHGNSHHRGRGARRIPDQQSAEGCRSRLSCRRSRCRKARRYGRDDYVTLLKLVYDILVKMRKDGLLAIEADLENPENSTLFQKYPKILEDHHMIVFITDCLRLIVGGTLDPHELESLLEYELETHHKEAHEPSHAVQKVADALPGFGIVAAVLGIVNTMSAHRRRGHGDDRPQGGRGAGRHVPRHSRRVRFRRPHRERDGTQGERGGQSLRSREDGAGRERARLRAAGRGGIRAQAAVQRSAPDVRRPRSAPQRQAAAGQAARTN